jgi:hypothetical protein
MEAYFADPDQVFKDFSILAQYCHAGHIRLLGGEPLLHPNLLNVIDAVRESGVSECTRVVTNGMLLNRMPEKFWEKVDQVHVSLYPACKIGPDKLRNYRHMAAKHNTELVVKHFHRFRESFSEWVAMESDLVKRIYSTCKIAHAWRCLAIFKGYIYRCSQSIMISRVSGEQNRIAHGTDGLQLTHDDAFRDNLLNFLASKEPLKACQYCLGSVGQRFKATQESRQGSLSPSSGKEMIDWKYLRFSELVGVRPAPHWLKRFGKPYKMILLALFNSIHNKRARILSGK